MKMTTLQGSLDLYEKNMAVKPLNERAKTTDKRLSVDTRTDFTKALESARGASDIREDKVADIKERMKNGTYNVSAEDVARKILQRW